MSLYENVCKFAEKLMRCFAFVILLFIFSACSTVRITHLSETKKISKPFWLYALPKSELYVDVELEKKIHIAGPYANFAEKYLGIANVSKRSFEQFTIKDISVNTNIVADSEQIFVVQYSNKLPWRSIQQTHDGIVLAINTDERNFQVQTLFENTDFSEIQSYEPLFYKELSKSPIIKEKIDTIYKTVKVDTIWTKVPVQRKTSDTLKPEDKAKEAANLIFDIRMRMLDLFSGELETLPQGEAAEYIAHELRQQEQEYLELFLGKTFITTLRQRFKIVPTYDEKNLYVVAFFSEKKGLLANPEKDAEPILLQIKSSQAYVPAIFQILKLEKAKKNEHVFYIKTPNRATVKLLYDNHIIKEKDILYYQSGRVVRIPLCLLKKGSFYIHDNVLFFNQ